MAQDNDGIIWVGTWNGLAFYDGYRFVPVRDLFSVGTRISEIICTGDGMVWYLTYNGRIYMFDTKRGITTDISAKANDEFGIDAGVAHIYIESNGVHFTTDHDSKSYLITPDLNIEPDNESKWREPDTDLSYVDGNGRKWQILSGKAYLDGKMLNVALSDDDVSLFDSGLIIETAKGTILIAEPGGFLCYYDETSKMLHPVNFDKTDIDIHNVRHVRYHFVDNQNNIWSYGQHNLIKIYPNDYSFVITPTVKDFDIRAFWVGADGSTVFPPAADRMYSRLVDSRGWLWEGYKDGGLRITKPDGRTLSYIGGDKSGFQGTAVFDIYEDSKSRVWIACYDGGFNLALPEGDGVRFVNSTNTLNYPYDEYKKVRRITSTADSVIILSTSVGLVAFDSKISDPAKIKFHTYKEDFSDPESLHGGNVMYTLVTRSGDIYVSTMSGGLIKVKSGKPLDDNLKFEQIDITRYTEGIVMSMVEDFAGNIWLARENSVERYNPREGSIRTFGRNAFGTTPTFTEAKPMVNPADSSITLGILGGMLNFNPNRISQSAREPKIVFTTLYVSGNSPHRIILNADKIEIQPDQRNLIIDFTAVDNIDNEGILYAYKIEGSGGDWQNIGKSHSVSLAQLPPGKNKLMVRSTDADGRWLDNVAEIEIYVVPKFSETFWPHLLLILALLLIGGAVFYIFYSRQRHRSERDRLEAKLQQLLRDLNVESGDRPVSSDSIDENAAQPLSSEPVAAVADPIADKNASESVSAKDDEPVVVDDKTVQSTSTLIRDRRVMEQVVRFVLENIDKNDIRTADIARAVEVAPANLIEIVNRTSGMKPSAFVRYLRIDKARKMIVETSLTFSEISYACGFSDPNYFSKAFRKATGKSPSEMRIAPRS